MNRLLLILSLTLGLANPVFALEAGGKHANPYKMMTKGQVIAGYFSCLHEDYQMIFNPTGKTLRYALIDCVCGQIKR